MAKARNEKLTPVPKYKPRGRVTRPGTGARTPTADAVPDLSHIRATIRHLARLVSELHFHPTNPMKHDEDNIAGIRASLRVSGQYHPLIASNRTGALVVIIGNGRLAAGLANGYSHMAVDVWEGLSEAQENRLAIADNRTSDLADYDHDHLAAIIRELDTGNDPDLDAMMAKLAEDEGIVPKDEGDAGGSKASANVDAKIVCPECGHQFEAPGK